MFIRDDWTARNGKLSKAKNPLFRIDLASRSRIGFNSRLLTAWAACCRTWFDRSIVGRDKARCATAVPRRNRVLAAIVLSLSLDSKLEPDQPISSEFQARRLPPVRTTCTIRCTDVWHIEGVNLLPTIFFR